MSANKSHHYVPQFYMRLFSGDAGERVGVFVIDTAKFIPQASVRGQACKDYLYGTDGHAERAFGEIENATAPILKAIAQGSLPRSGSESHQALMLYLSLQHSRTLEAEALYAEGAEQTMRAMLRTELELEGNTAMLAGLERVRMKRNNAIGETVMAGMIGAMLLTDLSLLLVHNDSSLPLIASDAPVALHNRMFESTELVGTAGYANVGLQLFLPLGPNRLLVGYDPAAYTVLDAHAGIARFADTDVARRLNDLQWEAAGKVLLTSPAMDRAELQASAERWAPRRAGPRTIFRQTIVSRSETEVRVRQGTGPKPSTIKLDLPFLRQTAPSPPALGEYDVAPIRDAKRAAHAQRIWEEMGDLADQMRQASPP